ncbi:SOS response-associated peptidase family protein [Delftia acidovorans]|uniref:SOS response-associated peptidase family protein n=1 Tax=Delftia acidovorans TaxID=80866 RepID=UPI001EFDDD59|nr:SOS response-associated peptidase family protein [Delftia acidovorans]MCG8985259.1 SOS response-associated peptidase family protein [Delftia acidovorans]
MAGFSAALQSSQKTLFDLQAQVRAAATSVAQLVGAVATALPSMQAVVKAQSDAIEASIAKEEEVWAKRQANFEAELAQAAKKKNSQAEVARITGAMQDAERDYLQAITKLRAEAAIADAKAADALSERISNLLAANAATQLQIEAAQQEAKAVGLTGDALRAFNQERLESSIPLALRMQAAWAGEIGELGKLGNAAREQIQAFRDLAKAQGEARAKQLVYDYTKGIADGNRLLQAEISLMGQTERARETALEQLRIQLDLEKQIAAVKASMADSPERAQMIADLEASAAIAKANAASRVFLDDWKESVKQYDEVFRRGFADMVNGGKSAWKSFTTSLVTTFKTSVADQIYKMFLQPFVVRIVGSLMGIVGGTASALGGGGAGGAATSLLGSGGSGIVSNLLFGGMSLTTVGSSIGAGVMATLTGSSLGGAGVAGILAGGSSALGMFGGALPYLGAGLALVKILSSDWFGTRRTTRAAKSLRNKHPWARGQRCIIPAMTFDEPNWESGKNVWWRFARADGDPWGLAGLWNIWTDHATGQVYESYTMLTINADTHPLMSRMHKPDPKLPADKQDKRSVIPIELADVDQWLAGTVAEASQLLRVAPVEVFQAGPVA